MDVSKLIPEGEIQGEDAGETAQLKSMLEEARGYISSFEWAPPIAEAYMGIGIGGVLAVFLFEFTVDIGDEGDKYLWVVVGDLPSAYLVTDDASVPVEAMEVYCELIEGWVEAVKSGSPLDQVFPVEAPADPEHAEMLLTRVRFIRERIIPECAGD